MDSQTKILDTFQIVGFIVSAAVSLVLVLTEQDTIASVSLGLVLAALTQLFDLQIRHSASEERLLKANALSQALHRDEWLFKNIQQIVAEYEIVKDSWFQLFKLRASDSVVECKNVLHTMAEGYMVVDPQGRYAFGSEGFRTAHAKKTLKAVSARDEAYWHSTRGAAYFGVMVEAIQNGVSISRVFIHTPETLEDLVDVLERQQDAGIEVFIAYPASIPKDLYENMLIMDDQLGVHWEFTVDGQVRQERITTDPTEVQNMIWKFEMLLRHAHKLEEVIGSLKGE